MDHTVLPANTPHLHTRELKEDNGKKLKTFNSTESVTVREASPVKLCSVILIFS